MKFRVFVITKNYSKREKTRLSRLFANWELKLDNAIAEILRRKLISDEVDALVGYGGALLLH